MRSSLYVYYNYLENQVTEHSPVKVLNNTLNYQTNTPSMTSHGWYQFFDDCNYAQAQAHNLFK
jgi:hypothetical protein